MKTTEEQKQKIKEYHEQGVSCKKIADMLNMNRDTVYYWTNDRKKRIRGVLERAAKFSKEKRRELYLKSKGYAAIYFKNRYWNDEEFREKHRKLCREYKRHQKKIKEQIAA